MNDNTFTSARILVGYLIFVLYLHSIPKLNTEATSDSIDKAAHLCIRDTTFRSKGYEKKR